MAVCQKDTMAISAGDQISNYRCSKDLPNLVSTAVSTHALISHLFTSADKMKCDLKDYLTSKVLNND